MRPYLNDLMTRMADQTPTASSDQSPSWNAHREAEGLADRSMLGELMEYAEWETDRHRRSAAYFIIGKLGLTLPEPACAAFLIGAVGREKDQYIMSRLLTAIGDIHKPASVDLRPIYPLLADRRWLIRHAAIQSLNNSESPEAEDRIIAHLSSTQDNGDMTYCNAVLNRIGTPRSLPAIEANLDSRNRDVRGSAQMAIAAIRERFPG